MSLPDGKISVTQFGEYGAVIYNPPLTTRERRILSSNHLGAIAIPPLGIKDVKIGGEHRTLEAFRLDHFGFNRTERLEGFVAHVCSERVEPLPDRAWALAEEPIELGDAAAALFKRMQAAADELYRRSYVPLSEHPGARG
jgi:hypothetical protein